MISQFRMLIQMVFILWLMIWCDSNDNMTNDFESVNLVGFWERTFQTNLKAQARQVWDLKWDNFQNIIYPFTADWRNAVFQKLKNTFVFCNKSFILLILGTKENPKLGSDRIYVLVNFGNFRTLDLAISVVQNRQFLRSTCGNLCESKFHFF